MSDEITAVVTGAAGFIGKHVVSELIRSSDFGDVLITERKRSYPCLGESRHICRIPVASNDHFDSLRSILGDREVHLIHLAGNYISQTPDEVFSDNLGSTLAVLDALKSQLSHITLVSSVAVYGLFLDQPNFPVANRPLHPDSSYGRAKALSEWAVNMIATHLNTPRAILRCSSVYGEGNRRPNALTSLARAITDGTPYLINSRAASRDYVHVSDVARAIVACSGTRINNVYEVGSGSSYSPTDLVAMARTLGFEFETELIAGKNPSKQPELGSIKCDMSNLVHDLHLPPPIRVEKGLAAEIGLYSNNHSLF